MYPQGWFSVEDQYEYRRLVQSLPDGGSMVEVGVWLGRSLCSLADIIRRKRLTVYAVDTFTKRQAAGHPPLLRGQREIFLANVRGYGLNPQCYTMPSLAAARLMPVVDFVFLDDDHRREHVGKEIPAWLPKTRLLMGGHDYGNPKEPGVKSAVDAIFPVVSAEGLVWSVGMA